MFNGLDASSFEGTNVFYEKQFEVLLDKMIICYGLMSNDCIEIPNDENKIRDIFLLKYLKNNEIRNKIDLYDWHFEREVQEDYTTGRTDIKIISQNTFRVQEAYYIIECKRINNINVSGITGLNAEYIKEGIRRFTSNFYSSYYRVNCMIGFVIENQDIENNIKEINKLLMTYFSNIIKTKEGLTRKSINSEFKYSYQSKHSDNNNKDLRIYHLMFNLSSHLKVS